MLNSIPFSILVGSALGTMAGLGLGGGSLLVLWLTGILHTSATDARVINLLFFIPSALISILINRKRKKLQIRPLLPAMILGSLAAIIFSRLSTIIDETMLKRLFGILLLLTGMQQLFYRPRKAK